MTEFIEVEANRHGVTLLSGGMFPPISVLWLPDFLDNLYQISAAHGWDWEFLELVDEELREQCEYHPEFSPPSGDLLN